MVDFINWASNIPLLNQQENKVAPHAKQSRYIGPFKWLAIPCPRDGGRGGRAGAKPPPTISFSSLTS